LLPASNRLSTWPQCLIALLVAWWAFAFQFVRPYFYNDHFDHLSKARQVLLGELPQRDFFDEGRPLTIYLSAAVQKISPTLFSEFLLTTVAIAVALVYVLARSLTASTWLGVIAAMVTISMQPRLYAYPKVMLFPLSLSLLWRYIDRPDTRRLVVVAVMTVLAFLFRYDYGGGHYVRAVSLSRVPKNRIAGVMTSESTIEIRMPPMTAIASGCSI
jgi:hypothetical protein